MSAPAPWKVGDSTVFVVGMEGTITALDAETITINGITLPRMLDHEGGVRYLSVLWPSDDPTQCDREHCDGGCDSIDDDETTAQERVTALEKIVRNVHDDDNHSGPFAFCASPVCQWANR